MCYEVSAEYQGHTSQHSSSACVYFCIAPENVAAEYVWNDGDYFARITWTKNVAVDYAINQFKVFRSQGDSFELIGEVESEDYVYEYSFDDTTASIGSYQYMVSASYRYTDCEINSEPVICEVTSIGETTSQVSVYPNPTHGIVNIKAEGMQRVTVVNTMGQVLMTREINQDEYTLDLSAFGNGMFMVNVTTGQGTIVKKINVLR